ncbi:MAG: hypothetical protein Q9220_005031 [cf. Caloplaca sp. 1 TL-2023]
MSSPNAEERTTEKLELPLADPRDSRNLNSTPVSDLESGDSPTSAHDEQSKSTNRPDEVLSAPDNRPRNAMTGEPLSLLREILLLTVICLAQLMTQAGVGQALAITNIASDELGVTDPASRSWELAAYSLTVGTFILPAGRWGDVFGHKRMFVWGFCWFGLWSILVGVSVYVDSIFFDFCRAMQGIGPAVILPNGIAIIGTVYEASPRKNMAFALFGSVAPGGSIIGAIFASIFAQLLWWPWAYWAMAIACCCISAVAWVAIPACPTKVDSDHLVQKLDGLGSLLGVGGLVLINVAWNQGSSIGWTTTYTYILLIIGFGFLSVFAFVESRAAYPLIPRSILNANTGFVLACMACGWATFGIWVYYSFSFLLNLRAQTPLLTSAEYVPAVISGLLAGMTCGLLMSRVRHAYIMLAALICFTVGTILIATAPVDQSYWAQSFVSILIMPWGMDMSFPAGTLIMSAAMPREHQGLAASLVTTVVNYSISLGLGFGGTVESNVLNGGTDMLKGYRAALYMGIGLAGLGVVVAALFTFMTRPGRTASKGY